MRDRTQSDEVVGYIYLSRQSGYMSFTYYLSNQPVFGPCVARVLILERIWQRCLKIVSFSECNATFFVSMN